MSQHPAQRILVIDDNPAIHEDFRKILIPEAATAPSLQATAASIFGRATTASALPPFEIDSAAGGQEGLMMVRLAAESGRPYAMAYVDVRMPNGWDGIETISHLWREFPELQVVICTAFSDYSWEEIQERLGQSDRFLILKKPFDNVEVRQLTFVLAKHARDERALRESEESFRRLVESVKDYAIITLDLDGRVRSWNAGAQQFMGHRTEDILGRHFACFYPMEEEHSETPARALETAATLGRYQDEGWRVRKDGTRFWAEVVLTALSEKTGRLRGFVIVMRDITERKRAAESLRKAHEELEARVTQRTAELGVAVAEANRANQAKSEFLSRTSHELRTPMNAILGFAQLLDLDPELAPRTRECIAEILRGGHHLLGLINEMLDLARIESGQLTVSMEAIPVQDLTEECLSLLQPLAVEMQVELVHRVPHAAGVLVMGDRQRLRQVLLNLLSNAIKYNRPLGRVSLECSVCQAEGRPTVCLSVRDTGIGIGPEKMPRLFTPFDRLDAERTHTHIHGAGLGLALSKSMVELMGGKLSVESAVGQGSCFWVELTAASLPGRAPVEDAAVAAESRSATGESWTVIYIEDDLSSLRLMQKILAQRPAVELLTAMHGERGLALIREQLPRLVLLDLNLPGFGGLHILSELQNDPETQEIPVVVISADATASQVERALGAGAKKYLTKPIVVGEVLALVDEMSQLTPAAAS